MSLSKRRRSSCSKISYALTLKDSKYIEGLIEDYYEVALKAYGHRKTLF